MKNEIESHLKCNATNISFSKMAAISIFMIFSANSSAVYADTYWESVVANAGTVLDTRYGFLSPSQEIKQINDQWAKYNSQRAGAFQFSVPQNDLKPSFNPTGPNYPKTYPVQTYRLGDIGTQFDVRYFFIDPNTGLTTSPWFTPFSVEYYILEFPETLDFAALQGLDENGISAIIRPLLKPLGTSYDSTNNFQLSFNLSGFEPIIFSFPQDSSGNEITGDVTAGWISTVQVPEPQSWSMMIAGFGLIGLMLRRRIRLPEVA